MDNYKIILGNSLISAFACFLLADLWSNILGKHSRISIYIFIIKVLRVRANSQTNARKNLLYHSVNSLAVMFTSAKKAKQQTSDSYNMKQEQFIKTSHLFCH